MVPERKRNISLWLVIVTQAKFIFMVASKMSAYGGSYLN